MRANWTNRDPVIAQELRALGRSGVPLYVVYPEGHGSPLILPALLTPRGIVAAVRQAAAAELGPGELVQGLRAASPALSFRFA